MNRKRRRSLGDPDIPAPPPAAERLLEMLHTDRGGFTHLGDFAEVYRDIHDTAGPRRASRWYWSQTFRSIPGLVVNHLYWKIAMLRNYITIAFRNLIKNRGFGLINIVGLSVGMASFILIMAYVQNEWSYDRFLPNGERIHRLLSRDVAGEENRHVIEWNDHFPEMIAPMLESEIPEIAKVTRWMGAFSRPAVLKVEGKPFIQSGLYADRRFLEVFRFTLLRGRADQVLSEPGSIVITQPVARKLFGNRDPIGRPISYREKSREYELTVSGVLEDVPKNSTVKFDYLLSLATLRGDKRNDFMFDNMDVGNFFLTLELMPGSDPAAAERKLNAFAESRGIANTELSLQPIRDVHLFSRIERQRDTNNEIRYVVLFSSIAAVILMVACINAMNLATARAGTRSREIGIRKVSGANRRQLVQQFLGESLFLAAAAMGLALLLMRALLEPFRGLVGVELDLNLPGNPALMALVIGSTLFVGLVSGSYPALFLSALKPVGTLRDINSGKRGGRLRNVLVVIQFTASITLIIGTLIISRQMNYVKTQRLGFDRDHVVIIPIREGETKEKQGVIKQALLQNQRVEGVSISAGLPTNIRSRYLNVKFETDSGEIVKSDVHFDYVDEDFMDVFRIELEQGRFFSRAFSRDRETAVVVNRELARRIGWRDPLGKRFGVGFNDDEPLRIIGVVKDFNFSTFHSAIQPMALFLREGGHFCVRVRPGNVPETIASLKTVFEAHTKGQPFEFEFLDDSYNRLYGKEMRTGKIFGYFAGLTLLIACLGLFGLAAFAVERRIKEIGIRKVLGATVPKLAGMLSGRFARLVLIANLAAWPLAYVAMHRWLRNFTYRIEIGPGSFLAAGGAALLIAFLTISFHTLRAALANPADTLRCE